MITTSLVQNMNPCEDRFDNFVQQYPNYSGSLSNFLSLTNITYSDKLWVVSRYLSFDQMVKWSIKCAESVKVNFIADSRVEDLLSCLKSIEDFSNITQAQRDNIESLLYTECTVPEMSLYEAASNSEKSQLAETASAKFAAMSTLYTAKFALNGTGNLNASYFACCSSAMKARKLDPNINEFVDGDYSSSSHANSQKDLNLQLFLEV